MARKRHSDEEVLKLLGEIALGLMDGDGVRTAYRSVDVSASTYYNWRCQCGGASKSQLPELHSYEKENARLKKLVAAPELDKLILEQSLSHLRPRA